MNGRSILRTDLCGRLSIWRKRYESGYYMFDYSRVECVVQPEGDAWRAAAFCYCSDPHINGFSMSQMARVYKSRRFASSLEAEAHLVAEVRNAARRHTDAGFYRYRELPYVRDGVLQNEQVSVYEYYDGTGWIQADVPVGARRCESCAFQTDELVCPQCGGLARS